jgi:hypothetical protein
VLDAFELSPALVKTPLWDVVAWNRAAAAVLTDYATLEANQRNILRLMFSDLRVRAAQPHWESVARFVVAAFRADATRAGAADAVNALVDEMCRTSPEFEALWRENDVRTYGGGSKHLQNPHVGVIGMEFSAFAVDGRPDLSMIVYNPATPADADKVRSLLAMKENEESAPRKVASA